MVTAKPATNLPRKTRLSTVPRQNSVGREINSFEQFPQARFCYNRSPCSASPHCSSEPSFASCAVDKVCCWKTSPSTHVVSTPHSRRTADAWLRRLGTIYLALDGTLSQAGSDAALAGISAQPSRSYCSHGLLHRSDDYVSSPLWVLRHSPRSQTNPALQRHRPSEQPCGSRNNYGRRLRLRPRRGT